MGRNLKGGTCNLFQVTTLAFTCIGKTTIWKNLTKIWTVYLWICV